MIKNISRLQFVLQATLLSLLVAIVLAQANPLYYFPGRDSGLFTYMGSQILKGKLLYVDVWDNKGPLIFYINALGLYLGHGTRWGIWGIEYVFVFFAAFFGFDLMKKNWGLVPAIFGTLLWLVAFNNVANGGNFTEDYSLLFNFAALYLFWLNLKKTPKRVYQFLIGVTLSLSFLLRANNVGVQISIVLVTMISAFFDKGYRKSLIELVWIGLGSLCVLVLISLYFLVMGTLDKMIVAGYTYNFFYSVGGSMKSDLTKSFMSGMNLLGYLSTVPALLGLVVSFEKILATIRSGSVYQRNLYLLFLIGWPIEVILSSLSGRNYPHYYISWLPYIGLLSGLVMYTLIPAINEYLNKYSQVTLLVLIVLISVLQFQVLHQYKFSFGKLLFDRGAGIERVDPVAEYVQENTDPSDTVLVWGFRPYINLLARRDSPTGILSYPLLARSPFSDVLNARYLQDLVEHKPELIVDMVRLDNDIIPFIDPVQRETQAKRLVGSKPPQNLGQVFEFIYNNYHLETKINGVMIYRLNVVK